MAGFNLYPCEVSAPFKCLPRRKKPRSEHRNRGRHHKDRLAGPLEPQRGGELKLTGFRDALKNQIAQPSEYQELGFEERLSLLVSEELTCRENRKSERLVKQAKFRLSAKLTKLDYRSSRGPDKALIRSLGQGNWLTLKQNLLLTGATGSGKTYLACALGHNACRQGYKAY